MKKKWIMAAVFVLLGATGCHEDFLEEKAFSFVTDNNFYRTAKDAESAVNAVYRKFYDGTSNDYYGLSLLTVTEYPTEAVTTGDNVNTERGRLDAWIIQNGDAAILYRGAYQVINRANAVLDHVPGISMDETLKKRILGEALFLRSLAYFDLVRLFGGVPLRLTQSTSIEGLDIPRNTDAEVYAQIITDLTTAKDYLPSAKTLTGANKGRASRSAAKTLLAKVYLTKAATPNLEAANDVANAVTLLREVVADNDHSLMASYANLWDYENNENNAEIIFDIQLTRIAGLGGNLTKQLATINTGATFEPAWGIMRASIDFYNSFSPNDTRRAVTFDDRFVNAQGQPVVYDPNDIAGNVSKFPSETPGFRKHVDYSKQAVFGAEEPNFVVLRYADVWLMLAEALNEQGNGPNAEAYEAINKVRRRAFGVDINTPNAEVDLAGLDFQSFREALFTERRKEFVMEGHGWFDGVRFFDIMVKRVAAESVGADPALDVRPKAVISEATISDPKYRLFPIPRDVIERNPSITQNPGW